MSLFRLLSPALIAVSLASIVSEARAVVQTVGSASTASSSCQAALPAFEGLVRKRPLSVQNEGASPAFITCATPADNFVNNAGLYFNSIDGQDHIINCTAVVGFQGSAQYLTRQVIAPASGGQANITIVPANLNLTTNFASYYVSWSCQLPPGTGVNDVYLSWQQDIGN